MANRSLRSDRSDPRRNPRTHDDDREPSLAELLDDPILQTLMARDGVDRVTLERVIDDARRRLGLTAKPVSGVAKRTLYAEHQL
ncbi:MAG: hypothetical protein HY246_23090 [Proteobacteria bacterium]|nr:hypothetical protein [Pseudomonadota bacterium]